MSTHLADPTSARGRTLALVPVRALEGAKSRLGDVLDAEERRDLVVTLLRRTLGALRDARRIDGTIVVSADEGVLEIARSADATPLRQLGGGLNAALDQARTVAVELGADTVVVVPGDLPAVTAGALDVLVEASGGVGDHAPGDHPVPERAASRQAAPNHAAYDQAGADRRRSGARPVVALVPDRHGRGTNALLLRPPDVIPFAFGGDSRLAHEGLASAAGAVYLEVPGPLDLDLDTPEDLLLFDGSGPVPLDAVAEERAMGDDDLGNGHG